MCAILPTFARVLWDPYPARKSPDDATPTAIGTSVCPTVASSRRADAKLDNSRAPNDYCMSRSPVAAETRRLPWSEIDCTAGRLKASTGHEKSRGSLRGTKASAAAGGRRFVRHVADRRMLNTNRCNRRAKEFKAANPRPTAKAVKSFAPQHFRRQSALPGRPLRVDQCFAESTGRTWVRCEFATAPAATLRAMGRPPQPALLLPRNEFAPGFGVAGPKDDVVPPNPGSHDA